LTNTELRGATALKSAINGCLGRKTIGCSGFIGRRDLAVLKLKISPKLISHFVAYVVSNKRIQLPDDGVRFHEIIAKVRAATGIEWLSLDPRGRVPPQTVETRAKCVLLIDLPIELGENDYLVASARHRSGQRNQVSQTVV